MTVEELLEFAGEHGAVVKKGKVVALCDEDDDGNETRIKLPEGVTGWLGEHPEGADRGGHVPILESEGARIYDDGTGWYEYPQR